MKQKVDDFKNISKSAAKKTKKNGYVLLQLSNYGLDLKLMRWDLKRTVEKTNACKIQAKKRRVGHSFFIKNVKTYHNKKKKRDFIDFHWFHCCFWIAIAFWFSFCWIIDDTVVCFFLFIWSCIYLTFSHCKDQKVLFKLRPGAVYKTLELEQNSLEESSQSVFFYFKLF